MAPVPGECWKYYIRSGKKVNATFYCHWCWACIATQTERICTEKPQEYGRLILTVEEESRLVEVDKGVFGSSSL
ncbi:hypothetical protein C7212DRAFT_324852 [Tuber magnatum]|uniref:Uncharacterized protein n=1 Tax=Tuber magnatum TaxID=42249 RepID=A0A317SQK2_9PEZI|nr:hypothetical protein C7212DRAFT_324852 [Tuber magnatum]